MNFEIANLLAAIAGGIFGAAIGGLPAFIFTGVLVLIGVAVGLAGGDFDAINTLGFGPFFGPHVSFVAGAAAAAFAARRGGIENGKDITVPLVGLASPAPLLVGAAFGLGGYVLNELLKGLLVASADGSAFYTDTIALTVVILGIVARLAFGSTGIFGSLDEEARGRGRFKPGGERVWVAFQQGWVQVSVVGLGFGLLGAYLVTTLTSVDPAFAGAGTILGYGVSATILVFLQLGFTVPVTHHMSLPAAVAAGAVVTAGGGSTTAIILGTLAGIGGALLGELFSRLFLIHGDTHVDPPAAAILVMASIVFFVGLLIG